MDKKKLQEATRLLLEIHEDDDMLSEMADVIYAQTKSQAQGHVAEVMRYLMHLRDKKIKE